MLHTQSLDKAQPVCRVTQADSEHVAEKHLTLMRRRSEPNQRQALAHAAEKRVSWKTSYIRLTLMRFLHGNAYCHSL